MSEDFAKAKSDRSNESDDWSEFDFREMKSRKSRSSSSREIHLPKTTRLVLAGIVAGISSVLLSSAINIWIIRPQVCRVVDTAVLCGNSSTLAFALSLAIVFVFAGLYLSRKHTSRTLLISIASCIALASLQLFLGLSVVGLIIGAVFGALFFVFFAKLSALRNYILALFADVIALVVLWLLVRG